MTAFKPIKEGKVREIYDNGDSLIMVATDRISAFDVILKNNPVATSVWVLWRIGLVFCVSVTVRQSFLAGEREVAFERSAPSRDLVSLALLLRGAMMVLTRCFWPFTTPPSTRERALRMS